MRMLIVIPPIDSRYLLSHSCEPFLQRTSFQSIGIIHGTILSECEKLDCLKQELFTNRLLLYYLVVNYIPIFRYFFFFILVKDYRIVVK
jgi:hypothetical protein